MEALREQFRTILADLQAQAQLGSGDLLVIGCSTSEVGGEKIGTHGSAEVAEMIFTTLSEFAEQTGVELAFQGCEHINRALVVERHVARQRNYDEVTVVPVRKAGGAMAEYAYQNLRHAVVVEHIKAEAGIDIGDTFIGMHLKHVAVPVRSRQKTLGAAHVTMAKTRPKLIGGARTQYE